MVATEPEHDDLRSQVPRVRSGVVRRASLLDGVLADPSPVVAVVAPAGYGKTTVLAQWAEASGPPVGWVSATAADNDPAVLLGRIAGALAALEPIEPALLESIGGPGLASLDRTIPVLASILSSRREPFSLVLDHLEALTSESSGDVVAELTERLPPGSRLAVASRGSLPLPTASLRGRGSITEVGVDELAMDVTEATRLLEAAGLDLPTPDVAGLVERTEGWPVALYLAVLALREPSRDGVSGATPQTFAGDDRLVADYLRSEVIDPADEERRRFLRRTAVLDRLSGPLCDAVLATHGSQQVLESLEQSNLLRVPHDRRRGWFRYHHLLRDLLRTELERTEPEVVPLLHDRAASWFEAQGQPASAVEHAQEAGDLDRTVRLVASHAQPVFASGRVATSLGWLRWFEERGVAERYPEIAALASLADATIGRAREAERWLEAAEAMPTDRVLPDGSSVEGLVALASAVLARDGLERMLADGRRATELFGSTSTLAPPAQLLEGMAHWMANDADAADAAFGRVIDAGRHLGVMNPVVGALACQAALAIDRSGWDEASELVNEACSIVEELRLGDYLNGIVVSAVAARVHAHSGASGRAAELVMDAARLRPLATYASPYSTLFLLQLGHAHLEIADPAGARATLRQIREILDVRPNLGRVAERATHLGSLLDSIRQGAVGASSLTAAELRLLPHLVSRLTFPEIGERMFVSRHTVKSQAMSVYRKLGVSSRREAVDRAQELGLLGR